MQVQIFGLKKCQDTNKALRFFKERNITVHFVDLSQKAITKGELDNILRSVSLEELIDRNGKQYRKRNLEYMTFDIRDELLEDPLLFKTPIVRYKRHSSAGYLPDIWKEWVKSARE